MAVLQRDIVARTRMFLDEVAEASWSEAEVLREDNFAYQKYVSSVVQAFEDFYLTTSVWNLVATQQEYGTTDGVPSDIYKVRRLELNYDSASNATAFRKSMPINITDVKDSIQNSNYGALYYPHYYVYGYEATMKFGLIPIPTKNSTGGAKLWYVQKIINLVLPTDEVKIPYAESFADGIALIAAGNLLRKGQQEEVAASRYIAEGKMLRDEMIEELEERIADEAKVISDSVGFDMDFTEPF